MRYFTCEILGKMFYQTYKALYEDAMLVSLEGKKYGGRKITETPVFEFLYKSLNSAPEELITMEVILF